MKRIVLVLALVVAGCNAPAATPVPTPTTAPVTHTVTGTLILNTDPSWDFLSPVDCFGVGAYSDIAAGAPVTLRDEKGTILGATSLPKGTLAGAGCNFAFTLTGVPDTAKFYAMTVSHQGEISKSHDDLAAASWQFDLTLGS